MMHSEIVGVGIALLVAFLMVYIFSGGACRRR